MKQLIVAALLIFVKTVTAGEFYLIGEDGKSHGPYTYEHDADIQIGDSAFKIIKTISRKDEILERLESVRIPELDFRSASIHDVLAFLTEQGRITDPKNFGINIIYNPSELDRSINAILAAGEPFSFMDNALPTAADGDDPPPPSHSDHET